MKTSPHNYECFEAFFFVHSRKKPQEQALMWSRNYTTGIGVLGQLVPGDRVGRGELYHRNRGARTTRDGRSFISEVNYTTGIGVLGQLIPVSVIAVSRIIPQE